MMKNYDQLIEYFFPTIQYVIVDQTEPAHICLTSNHLTNEEPCLRDNELNIFISIENLTNPNFKKYRHYNKYGEYGDQHIKLYIYSHITNIIKTDHYLAIPCIYSRINYFKKNYNLYFNHEKLNTSFKDKKFCLMINKSNINPMVKKVNDLLQSIERVDNISQYDKKILNKSCYDSIELLEVLNKYKFIICFENSSKDGYITEKIFNCLFAKTIPIYWGSSKSSYYFSENGYIKYSETNNEWIEKIKELKDNEIKYNEYINSPKISKHYDDEDYANKMLNYISENISK
jgi:hypothetical protein